MDEEVRFRLLYDLGCAFAARIEIDQLIPLVVTKCREALDAEGASVLLLDDERKELYFPYISEEDPGGRTAARAVCAFRQNWESPPPP